MKLKEIYIANKKKITLFVLAIVLSAAGYFGLGVQVDTTKVFKGDLSGIGEQLENAPE